LSSEKLELSLILPQTVFEELAMIAKYSDQLKKLLASASELTPRDNLDEIAQDIAKKTRIPKDHGRLVLSGLLSLNALLVSVRSTASHLVDLIAQSLEKQATPGWRRTHLKRWKDTKAKIAEAIESIGEVEVFLVLNKEKQLTYSYQNILTEIRIINEIRPVYNKEGSNILKLVMLYSLLIDYTSGGESKRIDFALDDADVAELKRLCERAQRKTAVAKARFSELVLRISVPREQSSD
jgi:hypothetical protein